MVQSCNCTDRRTGGKNCISVCMCATNMVEKRNTKKSTGGRRGGECLTHVTVSRGTVYPHPHIKIYNSQLPFVRPSVTCYVRKQNSYWKVPFEYCLSKKGNWDKLLNLRFRARFGVRPRLPSRPPLPPPQLCYPVQLKKSDFAMKPQTSFVATIRGRNYSMSILLHGQTAMVGRANRLFTHEIPTSNYSHLSDFDLVVRFPSQSL